MWVKNWKLYNYENYEEMKIKKGPGYDSINTETVKNNSVELAPLLTHLLNRIFLMEICLKELKFTIVEPIVKTGNHLSIGDLPFL